jgi:hypothetical protein
MDCQEVSDEDNEVFKSRRGRFRSLFSSPTCISPPEYPGGSPMAIA